MVQSLQAYFTDVLVFLTGQNYHMDIEELQRMDIGLEAPLAFVPEMQQHRGCSGSRCYAHRCRSGSCGTG